MMKRIYSIICILLLTACSFERPTQFSEKALTETFINLDREEVTFQSILNKHKSKKILIDIWASWCKDCIVTMPELKKLQKENPDVSFVFLSLDKTHSSWERAIRRYKITGDHYFMKEGKKGSLGDFLNLWWIPRYVVVSETGEITLFKATKITSKNIRKAFKK